MLILATKNPTYDMMGLHKHILLTLFIYLGITNSKAQDSIAQSPKNNILRVKVLPLLSFTAGSFSSPFHSVGLEYERFVSPKFSLVQSATLSYNSLLREKNSFGIFPYHSLAIYTEGRYYFLTNQKKNGLNGGFYTAAGITGSVGEQKTRDIIAPNSFNLFYSRLGLSLSLGEQFIYKRVCLDVNLAAYTSYHKEYDRFRHVTVVSGYYSYLWANVGIGYRF